MDKYNFTYEIVEHDKNIIGSREELAGSLLESLYRNVIENQLLLNTHRAYVQQI